MSRKTTLERFDAKFEPCPNTGCWLWNASTLPSGYGQFCLAGKMKGAHRVAYELYIGPIPDGLHVLHACDVTWCVNPEHLFLGTHRDNMQDMTSKGRGKFPVLYGEDHYMAKLTSEQVLEIHRRAHAGELQSSIAAAYQISQMTVSAIKTGRLWVHVTGAGS